MTSAEKQHLQTNKALRPEFFTAFGRFFLQSTAPVPLFREHPPTTDSAVSSPEKSLITKGWCNVLTLYVL